MCTCVRVCVRVREPICGKYMRVLTICVVILSIMHAYYIYLILPLSQYTWQPSCLSRRCSTFIVVASLLFAFDSIEFAIAFESKFVTTAAGVVPADAAAAIVFVVAADVFVVMVASLSDILLVGVIVA